MSATGIQGTGSSISRFYDNSEAHYAQSVSGENKWEITFTLKEELERFWLSTDSNVGTDIG